jgi:hypothetical protein
VFKRSFLHNSFKDSKKFRHKIRDSKKNKNVGGARKVAKMCQVLFEWPLIGGIKPSLGAIR